MSPQPPQLPPKPEVALALLQSANSLFIHLDPRSDDVHVPAWFKKQPQLVLQVGLNMTVAIPDLDVGEEGISCTLSFNRRPEFCKIPWDAIYGLVGEDGKGMIWPESVPAEVAASAPGRAASAERKKAKGPKLRLATTAADDQKDLAGDLSNSDKIVVIEELPPARSSVKAEVESSLGSESVPEANEEEAATEADAAATKSPKKRRELPSYLRVVK